jgi:hypothetical protein
MPASKICTARAAQKNSVNFFQKWKVHLAYRKAGANYLEHCQVSGDCKIDHLISLNLGGSKNIKNLWPQAYNGTQWNGQLKDKLENELSRQVCQEKMTVREAQSLIAVNWIEAYCQIFKDEPVCPVQP